MGKHDDVLVVLGKQNPLKHLKTSYKEFETHFKNWIVKHSFGDALVSTFGAAVAAALCYNIDSDGECPLRPGLRFPMLPVIVGGGRLERARNIAVAVGVHAGTRRFIKGITGKENLQTSFVSGFSAGFVVSLVCGMNGTNAISNGVLYGLVHGGYFKVQEKLLQPGPEHVFYKNTRDMLSSLGLHRYEKNFKKGLLTDKTLPYLNDSDLQEVKIPVEARRLILDHIQRKNDVKNDGARREI